MIKTLKQIVEEHIEKSKSVASADMIAGKKDEIEAATARVIKRRAVDPALESLVQAMANAANAAMMVLPPQLHRNLIEGIIVQAVMEWEDSNEEFGKQLKNENAQ